MRAELISGRSQTVVIRCRKPGAVFCVNGRRTESVDEELKYAFYENEELKLTVEY